MDEARDGRPMSLVHRRLCECGVAVQYETMRRWLVGETVPPVGSLDALFSALGMSDEQRARAIAAAMRGPK